MEENVVLEAKEVECVDCGKKFVISPAEQKFYLSHDYALPKRCADCRKGKKIEKQFVCVDCGKEFSLTMSTLKYYERNKLEIPKRCPECIKFKKERNNISER